jgi:hypothetical protein
MTKGSLRDQQSSLIEVRGNVLAATAFLQGLATEELRREELDYNDPGHELLVAVRVSKPEHLRVVGSV